MRRREFLAGLVLAAATRPAWAQPRATPPRIAIFHPAIPVTLLTETGGGSAWRAFFAQLRRLGYVEGQNLIIERYSADGHRGADHAMSAMTGAQLLRETRAYYPKMTVILATGFAELPDQNERDHAPAQTI